MEFKNKVWKQGNSLILTVPKNKGIKVGDKVVANLQLEGDRIVCKCGKTYSRRQDIDHECYFIKFDNPDDADKASILIMSKINDY